MKVKILILFYSSFRTLLYATLHNILKYATLKPKYDLEKVNNFNILRLKY